MTSLSGCGFVTLADGTRRWGRGGAAGVLVRCAGDDGSWLYFLARRSRFCHQGGTWAVPGGALHQGEAPLAGALREFGEEIGVARRDFAVLQVHEDDHGGWSYRTVLVEVPEPFAVPAVTNWENGRDRLGPRAPPGRRRPARAVPQDDRAPRARLSQPGGVRSVPFSLALLAGGLAILNPCGFPLLPAFLTFYVGAEAEQLPRAPTRLAQGLLVGLLVTAGFLGLFSIIGLPVIYGATAVTRAVPWAGIAIGASLTVVGLFTLTGRRVGLPVARPLLPGRERRARTMVLFGVAYGVASLGCTLPVFLTLVGTSLSTGGTTGSLLVLAAYGGGMAVVLMALSVTAALLQQGLARRLRRLMPHLPRLTGTLLTLAGAYLTYYWVRIRFGPRATLASDPLVGRVTRFTAELQSLAEDRGGAVLALAALVVLIGIMAAWRGRRRAGGTSP